MGIRAKFFCRLTPWHIERERNAPPMNTWLLIYLLGCAMVAPPKDRMYIAGASGTQAVEGSRGREGTRRDSSIRGFEPGEIRNR